MRLKGIPILLYEKEQIGEDAFHRPVYAETPVTVENILVAPVSASDVLETTNLSGKKRCTRWRYRKETLMSGKTGRWNSLAKSGVP